MRGVGSTSVGRSFAKVQGSEHDTEMKTLPFILWTRGSVSDQLEIAYKCAQNAIFKASMEKNNMYTNIDKSKLDTYTPNKLKWHINIISILWNKPQTNRNTRWLLWSFGHSKQTGGPLYSRF